MSDNVSGPNGPKTAAVRLAPTAVSWIVERSLLEPAYLRIPTFCRWSGLSAVTVHRLCRRGLLRKVKIGGVSLICMASARELFAAGYPQPVRD